MLSIKALNISIGYREKGTGNRQSVQVIGNEKWAVVLGAKGLGARELEGIVKKIDVFFSKMKVEEEGNPAVCPTRKQA